MNWKGYGRKRQWPKLRHHPGICLEGLRKTKKNLSQDKGSPGRDFNPGPPEYEAGVLSTQSLRSVVLILIMGAGVTYSEVKATLKCKFYNNFATAFVPSGHFLT
jgi:hypothetical protein